MKWAGGVRFTGDNIAGRDDVLRLTSLFRSAGSQALLAIDHEGGSVQRIGSRQGLSSLPSARSVASGLDVDEARSLYAKADAELRAVGFNLNLAPVADLDDPRNPIIGRHGRSFSSDPVVVAAYALACVDGFLDARVGSAVKHFSGHGLSRGDIHFGPVEITSTWRAAELIPFRNLMAADKTFAVMIGHLTHDYFRGRPASLSPIAIQLGVRRILQCRGLVITDDLDMRAIKAVVSQEEAAVSAIAAGNDLILISNSRNPDPDLPRIAVNWIIKAIVDGRISRHRIAESISRFSRAKGRIFAPSISAAETPEPNFNE
jgi:beta-N-acetylhexosaminidase